MSENFPLCGLHRKYVSQLRTHSPRYGPGVAAARSSNFVAAAAAVVVVGVVVAGGVG